MDEVSLFDCAGCGQRYIMRQVEHADIVSGEQVCVCGAKLGSWHGNTSLEFSSLDLDRVDRVDPN